MVGREGLQPCFGGFRIDVTKTVREPVCSPFYFSKDTFDGIPISMGDVSKSEAESVEGGVEPGASIDEERGVLDLMFGAEFFEEHPRGDGGSRRKQADVKQVIRLGIDRGEQPELFVIDPDHGFVDRDLIWSPAIGGLLVGLLSPRMDGGSMAVDTKRIKDRDGIRE
jgi:hypothetical protein